MKKTHKVSFSQGYIYLKITDRLANIIRCFKILVFKIQNLKFQNFSSLVGSLGCVMEVGILINYITGYNFRKYTNRKMQVIPQVV